MDQLKMRILNKGTEVKHINLADGTDIHIYPGEEEDVPDNLYYKVKNRIDKDNDLTKTTAKKRAIRKYTNEELYDMNKDAQVKLIKRYGIDKIPRLEKDRVKLLLKLQG